MMTSSTSLLSRTSEIASDLASPPCILGSVAITTTNTADRGVEVTKSIGTTNLGPSMTRLRTRQRIMGTVLMIISSHSKRHRLL